MQSPAERAWFLLCSGLGQLLRAGRYSRVRIISRGGQLEVRKYRVFYAPLLVWMSRPLLEVLDAGVRVLPRREWVERERRLYRDLYGASIRVDADGALVLPCLAGKTLAILLEDPELEESVRKRAVALAVAALAELHARGLTHADAMAENVMVDLEAGVARWFDFETVHDSRRPMAWRRADDVRALLATCLLRTAPEEAPGTLRVVLDVYADEEVARLLTRSFTLVLRRGLAFQLGQAGLSFRRFREITRLLRRGQQTR